MITVQKAIAYPTTGRPRSRSSRGRSEMDGGETSRELLALGCRVEHSFRRDLSASSARARRSDAHSRPNERFFARARPAALAAPDGVAQAQVPVYRPAQGDGRAGTSTRRRRTPRRTLRYGSVLVAFSRLIRRAIDFRSLSERTQAHCRAFPYSQNMGPSLGAPAGRSRVAP